MRPPVPGHRIGDVVLGRVARPPPAHCRAGDEIAVGRVLAPAGTYVTPAMVAVFAAAGFGPPAVEPVTPSDGARRLL